MNDRIEIYHRPFDPNFAHLSFTEQDLRAIEALNRQTAQKFRTLTGSPFPEDPDGIDPQILAWRSSAYATAHFDPQHILDIHEHPRYAPTQHRDQASNSDRLLDTNGSAVLDQALNYAIERDALRKVECLDPEPGTQLRHVFYTMPSLKRLHFDSAYEPPLREDLQYLPGHSVRISADSTLFLDWLNLDTVLTNLSMHFSLGHIAHWNPTEDDPPETRRALVTWTWNGHPIRWTRTIRLVPSTYVP